MKLKKFPAFAGMTIDYAFSGFIIFLFKLLLLVIILFSINYNGYGFSSHPDSVLKKFPEVNVTADRLISSSALEFTSLTQINSLEIAKSGAWQLPDALNKVPGLYINNYGGTGGLKTVSIRGTSSSQSIVLIDGYRINTSQNGSIDLSVLPLSIFDNIEIVRGGASMLFGGNSVGGAINLITSPEINKSQISGKISIGSYNEYLAGISTIFPIENDFPIIISSEYINSSGRFPIEMNQFGEKMEIMRENNDYSNLAFTIAHSRKFTDVNFIARTIIRSTVRGIPGAVLQGHVETSRARLNEKEAYLILNGSMKFTDISSINFGLFGRINDYDYSDPDALGSISEGINTFCTNRDMQLICRYSTNIWQFLNGWSIEASISDLRGNFLQENIDNYVIKKALAAAWRIENIMDFSNSIKLSYQAGIRMDYFTDIGTAFSPLAGIKAAFIKFPLQIKSNCSYNFRPPSFNEMYYLNYGNPDLKPERSFSFDIGLDWEPLEDFNIQINGFIISTNNQISAELISRNRWKTFNLAKVLTRGIEMSAAKSFMDKKLNINLTYTQQLATDKSPNSLTYGKKIIYVPQEFISTRVDYNLFDIVFGSNLQYTSYRYASSDNSYDTILPAYFILDGFISYNFAAFNTNLKLRLDCNNIFNENYYIIMNYPMPGRIIRGSVFFDI